MKEDNSLLNFFLVREPYLPLEFYTLNLMNEDNPNNLINLCTLPEIKEALLVSNPQLLSSIEHFDKKSIKKQKMIVKSTLNYLIRMSTRATPHGLFSGIREGFFLAKEQNNSCHSSLKMRGNDAKKYARVNISWILELAQKLQQSDLLDSTIKIRTNPLLRFVDGKIINIYPSEDIDVSSKGKSILRNVVIDKIMSSCADFVGIDDVISIVSKALSLYDSSLITSYLKKMIKKELLITDLIPPTTCLDPLSYISEKLIMSKSHASLHIVNEIRTISEMIKNYNDSQLGDNNDLSAISEKMSRLAECTAYLHVDLKFKNEEYLDKRLETDILKTYEIIQLFMEQKCGFDAMKDYAEKFIERYGVDVEVPVMDLLYETGELGPPISYHSPDSIYHTSIVNKKKNTPNSDILSYLYWEAISSGKEEIILDDAIIEEAKTRIQTKKNEYNSSCDLIVNLVKNTGDNKDHDYWINVKKDLGEYGAGRTSGRFCYMLSEKATEHINTINDYEQLHYKDEVIYAELTCYNQEKNINNLTKAPNIREFEIPFNSISSEDKHTIELNDLYVGYSNNSFYLKSKKLNKQVIPTSLNRINPSYKFPNLYRFLLEIGVDNQVLLNPLHVESGQFIQFSPRVRYNNIILSKKRWYINNLILQISGNYVEGDFYESLTNWKNKNNVPELVELVEGYEGLIYNLSNRLHVSLIEQKLKKLRENQRIVFSELDYGRSFSSNNCDFAKEYVFSIINRSDRGSVIKPSVTPFYVGQRMYLPGEEWVYFKIYMNIEQMDYFITKHLNIFINEEKYNHIKYSFFYIRYADPVPHIRLRINTTNDLIMCILSSTFEWLQMLKKRKAIFSYAIFPFEPEYERYGGEEIFPELVNWFDKDSQTCMELLEIGEKYNIDDRLLIIISIYNLLDILNLNDKQKFNYIKRNILVEHHFQSYRTMKIEIFNLLLGKNCSTNEMFEVFNKRKNEFVIYMSKLYSCLDDSESVYNVLDSVIHMHINRLMNINRKKEKEIIALVGLFSSNKIHIDGKAMLPR